jgi:hypothetical protein
MARTRGCDLRAVLAGAVICWAVAEGVAVAQEGAEATEELGNSYLLARRTTGQGSIIETLLFDGQAIVTEIAVPAPDAGLTAGTTGSIARTLSGSANAAPGGLAALPPGLASGFGGTWLTGEVIDDYLVLHRIRAADPVTHEIFREGRKVGSVTEVGPSIRTGKLAGRNSFAFESADDRFVVHLTQPDGTRIRATTEHGRFSSQVVERSAALVAPPRPGAGVAAPLAPSLDAVGPSIGRSPEPQRLARPQDATTSIIVEDPAPRGNALLPETVPVPRPSPLPRARPAIGATPVRTASPSPGGNSYRGAPEPITVAPAIRPKPATTSGNAPLPAAAAAPWLVAPPAAIAAPAATPKPAVTSVNAAHPLAAPAPRSATPTNATATAGPKPAVAAVAREPLTATPAKPVVRAPATASPAAVAPAARPKPAPTAENALPSPSAAARPVARPSRPPVSDPWLQ